MGDNFPVALRAVINFPVQNYGSKSGKISKIPAKCVKLSKYYKKKITKN